LQSNIRFAESLIRGRTNKGRGKSRIRNELKKHQISVKILATVMYALNIDWFELALKVFVKNMLISPLKTLTNSKNDKDLCIIEVLFMNKFAMRLNRLKINAS